MSKTVLDYECLDDCDLNIQIKVEYPKSFMRCKGCRKPLSMTDFQGKIMLKCMETCPLNRQSQGVY